MLGPSGLPLLPSPLRGKAPLLSPLTFPWHPDGPPDHLRVVFTFSRMKTRPLHGSVTTGSIVHEGLCKAGTIAHMWTAGQDSLSRKRCPGRLYQLRLNSAEVTNHPQTSVASNDDVLCFTQITRPSQAGDPDCWRHVFLEHGRAEGTWQAWLPCHALVYWLHRPLCPILHRTRQDIWPLLSSTWQDT